MASGQIPQLYSGVPVTNERNRSSSEGIVQAMMVARNKRLAAITRNNNNDTSMMNELRPYRNSHLRGLSHGSVLRTRPSGLGNVFPSSPMERRRLREGSVNHMSSLPERRGEMKAKRPVVEGAKGILFSLFQVHFHVSTLTNVLRQDDPQRNSLDIVIYDASTHVDRLNDAIEGAQNAAGANDAAMERTANEFVRQECERCIGAYTDVCMQLRNAVESIVANSDSRYVRSMMLAMYGSLMELRNACKSFEVPVVTDQRRRQSSEKSIGLQRANVNRETDSPERFSRRTAPLRRRPTPSRRQRGETVVHHPPLPAGGLSRSASRSERTGTPDFTPPSLSHSVRSRSGSRSTPVRASTEPSPLPSARTQEFYLPTPNSVVSHVNPFTGLEEIEEERIFERIFHQLSQAYSAALQNLPTARHQFTKCLKLAEQSREPGEIQLLWSNLIQRCSLCLSVSENLQHRLSNMRIKEPSGTRSQREFWQLCKSFLQSFVDLAMGTRDVKDMHILPADIKSLLRPVQKASRQAGKLIEASPWAYCADMGNTVGQHATATSATSANMYYPPLQISTQHSGPDSVSPPGSGGVPLPATPLSAALGPAAQATVPSSMTNAYSNQRFFGGDVFQRADALLSMPNQSAFFGRR